MKAKSLPKILSNIVLCIVMLLPPLAALAGKIDQVYITGSIANNSKYSWFWHFILSDSEGYNVQLNMEPYTVPTVGHFMIPATIGQTYTIKLQVSTFDGAGRLCSFDIKANSPHHATITMINQDNTLPVLCNYSGDPDNNTATITLSNNSHPGLIK